MSITYRQAEGSRGTGTAQRVILSIAAGGVVTITTGDITGGPAVGDIFEIFGDTVDASNNGFYTLTEILTIPSPDQYRLRPAPNVQAGGSGAAKGTLARIARLTQVFASTALTSVLIDSYDMQYAFVRVTGANFKTSVRRNDRLVIQGSATTANNGAWIIQEVLTDEVAYVRTPDGGTGMTAEAVGTGNVTVRTGRIVVSILNENPLVCQKTGAATFDIDAATKKITRSTGSWIADGFKQGHRVTIAGTGSNNGITAQVSSVTALDLITINGSLIDEASIPATATFVVYGLTWSYISSTGVPQVGPTLASPNFSSGLLRDFISVRQIQQNQVAAGEARTRILLEGIASISIDQTGVGTPSSWYIFNEIVVATNGVGIQPQTTGSWGSGNLLSVFSGYRPGNRYSCGGGSALVGFDWVATTGFMPVSIFGSYVDCTGVQEFTAGQEAIASLVRSRFNLRTGLVESCIAYGETGGGGGGLSFEGAGDQDNILLANQVGIASIGLITPFSATVGGLLVSDLVNGWSYNVSGVFTIENPRIDLELNGLISNVAGSNAKTYLFAPRFVSNDLGGFPTEIADLVVTVTQIRESDGDESVVPIDHDFTLPDGTLSLGGAFLTRETQASNETVEYYSHRVTIEGGGFQLVNEVIQMTSKRIGDWAVPRIAPDFEGGYNE